jgi:hypothetical protein
MWHRCEQLVGESIEMMAGGGALLQLPLQRTL